MTEFQTAKNAEQRFARQLRKVSREVAKIVKRFTVNGLIENPKALEAAVKAYSKTIEPWANQVVRRMLDDVNKKNIRAWKNTGKELGRELSAVLSGSEVGATALALQNAQVELITTIPIRAAERAQKLTQQAMSGGRRASEVAREIARTNEVTEAVATRIARTEIAKANTALTTARAKSVGATHYIWRTMGDNDVREVHKDKKIANKIFAFDDPPTIEGEGAHGPGDIWNCRCYPEPVLT